MARTVEFHKYELEWFDHYSVVEGTDIADAMMRAGLGGGAYRALKSWHEVGDDVPLGRREKPEIAK